MPGAYFRPRRCRSRRRARVRAALRPAASALLLYMGRRGDRRVVVRWFRLVSAYRAWVSHLAYRLADQGSSGCIARRRSARARERHAAAGDRRRPVRQSGSDPQHRAGHDLDHRLGGTGVLVGAARRCVEAGQSLECDFRACRDMLSARARGRGSWFRAALSAIAGGVARLPAARRVRLDGARVERQERPRRARGRARRLFRADVFRHGPVRSPDMARAGGDVHARLWHLCTVRPFGSHTTRAWDW
jgi:hypothetical protein